MLNTTHRWATFTKGRLKIKACACCGAMCLPSNIESLCDEGNIMTSPVIEAGYEISENERKTALSSQKIA